MSRRFLFVGEQPSVTAYKNGWTWHHGRLAAKTLFAAFQVCGIDPTICGFTNVFGDHPGKPSKRETNARLHCLRAAADAGVQVVALGNKVSKALLEGEVRHITMRHPAARGAGRARDVYAAHVKEVLCG